MSNKIADRIRNIIESENLTRGQSLYVEVVTDIGRSRHNANPTESVLREIAAERLRQDAKFGEQNNPLQWWLAILGEEYGEPCQATVQAEFGPRNWSDYREELIHAAAVAVCAIESFDRALALSAPAITQDSTQTGARLEGTQD